MYNKRLCQAFWRALKQHNLLLRVDGKLHDKIGYSNSVIRGLQRNLVYWNKLCRDFQNELNLTTYEKEPWGGEKNQNVWICWLQGIENAPDIVRYCYESVKYYLSNSDIHVITSDNFSDYIELPEYVISKWKQGIISNTHFSDIIRTALLVEMGGYGLIQQYY